MKLTNRSGYDTDDLRRFLAKAFREFRVRRDVDVVVVAAPKRSRGCAEVGGKRLALALAPPSYDSSYEAFLRRLWHLLRHECAHLRGLEHEEMDHELLYSLGPLPKEIRSCRIRYRGRAPNQMRGLG